MSRYRTIEIDFDVHKLVETERRGFDERPNDVLRRLLKLGDVAPGPSLSEPKTETQTQAPLTSKRPWIGEGVTLPHRTLLRMTYSGRSYEGQVIDGKWAVTGQIFDSPSGAASGIAVTRKGTKTKLDGWIYWHVKRPDDTQWIALDSLRPKLDVTLEDLGL